MRRSRVFFGIIPLALILILAACGGKAASSGGTRVNVTEKDFAITLDKTGVPAGDVTFDILNQGPSAHNFQINEVDKMSATIEVGKTTTLTVNLKPGIYTYICAVAGHEQLGMKGTVTVT